jgi:amino acid permease
MDSITSIKLLISGVIIGIVLFQTSLSAPIVFKFLKPDQSKIYIRKIFPKIFSLIFLLGVGFLSLHFLADNQPITSLISALLTVCFSLICYWMIPATNKARDEGDNKKFKLLHRLSVILTMIVFFANILWIFV